MTLTFDTTLFWMATALGISGAFVPVFIQMFLHIFMGETDIEANLRRQKCDLEAELGGISMVDEFAKYAKIKRKLNKVTDELSHQADMRSSCAMKTNLISSAILYSLVINKSASKYMNIMLH
ncbi:guided entry of tail-anchored proteins factor 1-like [Uloborus diversus]|uniref:guided entry of tail-anchored proteins factor 1-like n=1 Tax=Uloborus diversus TaxID=327109 RepID=UPI00240915DB|nr:guided entry of tail-anchored proteins factor 1-like [Uloborus diversus]